METLVTTCASLDTWSDREWTNGVELDELPEFTCLLVRTRFSVYQVVVVNGRTGEVIVRGGSHFPTFTRSRLEGSSMGGSLLKRLGIHAGFRMELRTGRHRLLTSRVQSIALVDALTRTPTTERRPCDARALDRARGMVAPILVGHSQRQ